MPNLSSVPDLQLLVHPCIGRLFVQSLSLRFPFPQTVSDYALSVLYDSLLCAVIGVSPPPPKPQVDLPCWRLLSRAPMAFSTRPNQVFPTVVSLRYVFSPPACFLSSLGPKNLLCPCRLSARGGRFLYPRLPFSNAIFFPQCPTI